MARTPRNATLETRSARLRQPVRKRPYWEAAGLRGAHLGYRRTAAGNGSWILRRYIGGQEYRTARFADADDYAETDHSKVLTYHEAIEHIRKEVQAEPLARTRYTVKNSVDDYVAWSRLNRKSAKGTEQTLKTYVVQHFGEDRLLSSLTPADFEKWMTWAFANPPAGRRKKPRAPVDAKDADAVAEHDRRRKSTLNRVANLMKACFNRAARNKHVPTDAAWRGLQRFEGAERARIQWLTVEQARALIAKCDPDFRRVVQAGMLTGARWGELRAMRASDFDSQSGTVLIAVSKSNKSRRIPLTEEGQELFAAWVKGRNPQAFVFTRPDGEPWGKHDQHRPMRAACAAAGIAPAVGFHALRHSYASLLVQAGVSLVVVAKALGHSGTRMVEQHYAHLAPSHVAEAIRAYLPTLGAVKKKRTKASK